MCHENQTRSSEHCISSQRDTGVGRWRTAEGTVQTLPLKPDDSKVWVENSDLEPDNS